MFSPFPHMLVLGHRGSPADALENTLRSLELALRHGPDGVEIDVRASRDGTPVVIHDATLDRTFGISGVISELEWPAIQRLTGARLPSLQQVSAWAAATGAWLDVELKAPGVEADTLRILDAHGLMDRVFLSSFDENVVFRLGEIAPDSRRFLLTESWDDSATDRFNRSQATGVCLHVDAAIPLTLDVIRHEGLPVVVWTVDEPQRIVELTAAGVAGIITNRPGEAVAALRAADQRS